MAEHSDSEIEQLRAVNDSPKKFSFTLTTLVLFTVSATQPIRKSKANKGEPTSSKSSTVLLGIAEKRKNDDASDHSVRDRDRVGIIPTRVANRDSRWASEDR